MSNSIKISPKHGVNPSLINCFFCGESKGIALMGKLKNDAEAPKTCIVDYEPCDKCKENMTLGVTLIEATEENLYGLPSVKASNCDLELYLTGRWCVLKEERAKEIFNDENLHCGSKLYLDKDMMDKFIPQ